LNNGWQKVKLEEKAIIEFLIADTDSKSRYNILHEFMMCHYISELVAERFQ
jgi:hypothetical protein